MKNFKIILTVLALLALLNTSQAVINISSTIVISSDTLINDNIVIHPGGHLIITNYSTLRIGNNKSIKILSSSVTNALNPGTLTVTNYAAIAADVNNSNDRWRGIFVVGNKNMSQLTGKMARLIVNMESTINGMTIGIRNYDYDSDPNALLTGGGIIQIKNSYVNGFIPLGLIPLGGSNHPLIEMQNYQNKAVNNSNILNDDFSYFHGSTFNMNSAYTGVPGTPILDNDCIVFNLKSVEGISFYGNNITSGSAGTAGIGIKLDNAGAKIASYNCNGIANCTNYPGNTFSCSSFSIFIVNNTSFHKLFIYENSLYSSNNGDMYMHGTNNVIIWKNILINCTNGNGLELINSTKYDVSENTLNGITPVGGINVMTGIKITNSGNLSNEIYKNNFNNVNSAIISFGHNRNGSSAIASATGLKHICNNMSNTTAAGKDIVMPTDNVTMPASNKGIASIQGVEPYYVAGSPNPIYKSVSNTFSTGINTGNHYINNQNALTYYGAPLSFSGNGTTVIAPNITCLSKICLPPCANNANRTLLASAYYQANKQAMLDSLQAQTGTISYAATLEQYQDMVNNVVKEYLGDPLDSNSVLQYDNLEQLLQDAAIDGYYANSKARNQVKKKLLHDYHLQLAGLHVQQAEYTQANDVLQGIIDNFLVSKNEIIQIKELKQFYVLQQQLLNTAITWTSISEQDKQKIINAANPIHGHIGAAAAYYTYTISKP